MRLTLQTQVKWVMRKSPRVTATLTFFLRVSRALVERATREIVDFLSQLKNTVASPNRVAYFRGMHPLFVYSMRASVGAPWKELLEFFRGVDTNPDATRLQKSFKIHLAAPFFEWNEHEHEIIRLLTTVPGLFLPQCPPIHSALTFLPVLKKYLVHL